jgi:hypothetical protein
MLIMNDSYHYQTVYPYVMSSLSLVRISDTYSSSTYNPITVNAYSQNSLSDSYRELIGYIMVSSSTNSL